MVFYGNPVLRINRTAQRVAPVLGHFGPNHFSPGLLGPNYFFYWGSSGLHSLTKILTLALASKSKGLRANTTIDYCQRVLRSKGLRGSIIIGRNDREYLNQTNCQEVYQTKVLSGMTIKKNACDYYNQKYCQEVPRSKRLLDSDTNIITFRKSQSNKMQRRITEKNTVRE